MKILTIFVQNCRIVNSFSGFQEVVPSVPVYYSDIQEIVQSFRVSQQHIQPSIFLGGLTFLLKWETHMSGQEENVYPSKSSTRRKVLLMSEWGR